MWLLAAALALRCSVFAIPTRSFGAGGGPRGEWLHAAVGNARPGRCRQHSAGTAAVAGSCICPRFVLAAAATQMAACHGILKGWLYTPQAELPKLSFLFLFNGVSFASVIKVLPTLLLLKLISVHTKYLTWWNNVFSHCSVPSGWGHN